MDHEWIIKSVLAEMQRQNNKWGEDRILPRRTWIAVLVEEVGEVARADLEGDISGYMTELIQAAAVCIQAVASEHTASFGIMVPEDQEQE